jgi:hypothetical protein
LRDLDDGFVKELSFVDPDHASVVVEILKDISGPFDRTRGDSVGVVALDVIRAVAVVDLGLKDLHLLACDLRPLESADELLGFPAEHAPANNLNDSARRVWILHLSQHVSEAWRNGKAPCSAG